MSSPVKRCPTYLLEKVFHDADLMNIIFNAIPVKEKPYMWRSICLVSRKMASVMKSSGGVGKHLRGILEYKVQQSLQFKSSLRTRERSFKKALTDLYSCYVLSNLLRCCHSSGLEQQNSDSDMTIRTEEMDLDVKSKVLEHLCGRAAACGMSQLVRSAEMIKRHLCACISILIQNCVVTDDDSDDADSDDDDSDAVEYFNYAMKTIYIDVDDDNSVCINIFVQQSLEFCTKRLDLLLGALQSIDQMRYQVAVTTFNISRDESGRVSMLPVTNDGIAKCMTVSRALHVLIESQKLLCSSSGPLSRWIWQDMLVYSDVHLRQMYREIVTSFTSICHSDNAYKDLLVGHLRTVACNEQCVGILSYGGDDVAFMLNESDTTEWTGTIRRVCREGKARLFLHLFHRYRNDAERLTCLRLLWKSDFSLASDTDKKAIDVVTMMAGCPLAYIPMSSTWADSLFIPGLSKQYLEGILRASSERMQCASSRTFKCGLLVRACFDLFMHPGFSNTLPWLTSCKAVSLMDLICRDIQENMMSWQLQYRFYQEDGQMKMFVAICFLSIHAASVKRYDDKPHLCIPLLPKSWKPIFIKLISDAACFVYSSCSRISTAHLRTSLITCTAAVRAAECDRNERLHSMSERWTTADQVLQMNAQQIVSALKSISKATKVQDLRRSPRIQEIFFSKKDARKRRCEETSMFGY